MQCACVLLLAFLGYVVCAEVSKISVKKVVYVEASVAVNGTVSKGRLSQVLLELNKVVCGSGEECKENNTRQVVTTSRPYYTTGRPWNYTTGRPWNYTTGRPWNYTTGRPWNYTTYRPYYTTGRPWNYTTSRPYYTTGRPWGYTTNRPYYTTNRPYYTSNRPYYTSNRPYYTTNRPYYTSNRPYYTSNRPYYTTDRPYYTTNRPYYTTNRPYYTSNRPWHVTTDRAEYTTTQRPYTDRTLETSTRPSFEGDLHECSDLPAFSPSGVYKINTDQGPIEVYCDMTTDGGNWTVIQSHNLFSSLNLYKSWGEYREGFGTIKEAFWLGNNRISALTMKQRYSLRIDMNDLDGNNLYAKYAFFQVEPESRKFRLTVNGYSGSDGDGLSGHNGSPFSARDVNNDRGGALSCSQRYGGGWWYTGCFQSDLNGYQPIWSGTRLLATEMKIRPAYL